MDMQVQGIFVLPTVEGVPPRALLLGEGCPLDSAEAAAESDAEAVGWGEGVRFEFAQGVMATWSADVGCWTLAGMPLGAELSEAITERAKQLGMEW